MPSSKLQYKQGPTILVAPACAISTVYTAYSVAGFGADSVVGVGAQTSEHEVAPLRASLVYTHPLERRGKWILYQVCCLVVVHPKISKIFCIGLNI